ncbi:sensor histidine kinase [Salinimicrobium sp. WS361]|uniref:sensor histidine kinase n=1 Tax=Salinimicrobium sp. WS361 TaxID=3425123 RepID=UPI003D6EE230
MPFYRTTRSFLLLFLWCNLALSQNYPVKHYNSANELPNNAVRSLLVDSDKALWIGTENGVVKKENGVLKYYFEEDGLALNSCWAIAEDKKGNLWFGSYGEGISIYDGFDFTVISEEDGLIHNEITKLFSYQDQVFVGTSDGVSIIDINTFEVVSLKNPPEKKLFRVQDFFSYNNEIYVATYDLGIFRINQPKDEAALVKVSDHKFIYSVLVDNDSIYSSNKEFFTKQKLANYVQEKDLTAEKLGASIIWDYVKTGQDRIFAAAWGIYDTNGGIYEVVGERLVSRASEFNISSKEVISLAYDPDFEKLYVGTRNDGLFEIALNPPITFQESAGKRTLGFARTKNASAVLRDDAILVKNGINEHSISLQQLKKWQEDYVHTTSLPLPRHEDHFYELDYSTVAEDIKFYDIKVHQDMFWVNTNIGLFAIKTSGEPERYLPLHSEEINFTPEGKLIETNPYGGVRVYSDLDAFDYTLFNAEDGQTPTMVVNSLQKGQKTYFLSIFSGLYVWKNGRFTSFLKGGIWNEKKLKHITEIGENLAISTEFGDVFIINDEGSFEVLEKIPRAKIRGNTISFMKNYRGTLIIGTEKGLTLYKDRRFIFMDKEQGLEQPLLSAEVHQNVLTIGSNNGVYNLDLDALIEPKMLVDDIELKEIFVNNHKLSWVPVAREDRVELAHNENTLLLKFSTKAHPYPHKLQYQYRLNKDATWSLASSKPEIFLPSLPPENYSIEVKVSDESTGLSFTRPLLNMAIFPPFWKTWWFGGLLVLIAGTGILGIYNFQIRQNRKFEAQKGLIQKRLEETKMEALLAQMNPHFIFNAMNSIQYYIMDNDIEKATEFLGDFSKLIRLNLDHCTRPKILLIEEIEYLQAYIRVENTRFNNAIQVIFEVDPSIDPYELEIPTMLLQTFVENVFVHAFPQSIKNPLLKVSFELLSDGLLQCKIEDNGVGFSSGAGNRLHESKGVNLVKERVALLGYEVEETLQVTSVKNEGTLVLLKLVV